LGEPPSPLLQVPLYTHRPQSTKSIGMGGKGTVHKEWVQRWWRSERQRSMGQERKIWSWLVQPLPTHQVERAGRVKATKMGEGAKGREKGGGQASDPVLHPPPINPPVEITMPKRMKRIGRDPRQVSIEAMSEDPYR
jgi:hypothetical protein